MEADDNGMLVLGIMPNVNSVFLQLFEVEGLVMVTANWAIIKALALRMSWVENQNTATDGLGNRRESG